MAKMIRGYFKKRTLTIFVLALIVSKRLGASWREVRWHVGSTILKKVVDNMLPGRYIGLMFSSYNPHFVYGTIT